jgi:hypothetical protein
MLPAIPCSTWRPLPIRPGISCVLLALLVCGWALPAAAASVTLRWRQPAGSSAVGAFRIYKAAPRGTPSLIWQGQPRRAPDGSYEAHVDLPEIDTGSPVWVWLTAVNAAGMSGPSNALSYGVVGQPLGAPGQPVWDLE